MSISILNCASMSPWFPRWHLGTPCLLVDTDQGPILVDTGLGIHDYEHPTPLVQFFMLDFGIQRDPEQAAVRQLARRGIRAEDIHHIVMTHLHFDHAGGIPDFPRASVHVHRQEYEAFLHPRSWIELAYDRNDSSRSTHWVIYDQASTKWLGFDAIPLPFHPQMYLIPLFGHTHGHCGVAIQDGDGWLFQCADALPTNAEFDLTPGWLNRMVIGHHVPHLRQWSACHPEVRLMAGHMWLNFFDER